MVSMTSFVKVDCRVAAVALVGLGLAGSTAAMAATPVYEFVTIDNAADANFNQVLGINKSDIAVGYDGDGTVKPNKGYMVVPKDHFSDENFPGSAQTQVIGINNQRFPATAGFWVDGKGDNFGFVRLNGNKSVAFPGTPVVGGVQVNQLLSINDNNVAAGFYVTASGNPRGYLFSLPANSYTGLTLPFSGQAGFIAAGVNDQNVICGAWTDTAGKSHGYWGKQGSFVSVDIPHSTGTTFFGLNNKGFLVGFYNDAKGVSHGVIYNTATKTSQTVDDPLQSATAAFGVTGTTINGINDANDVVGFYSDGSKVHGFLAWVK